MENLEPNLKQNLQAKQKYRVAFISFLCFIIISILVFFAFLQKQVVDNIEDALKASVARQSYRFRMVLHNQFANMEGIAEILGDKPRINDEKNMEILRAMTETGIFERMAVFDETGRAYYQDGAERDLSSRLYFKEAMAGKKHVMSNPMESKEDGARKVILAVPVYRNGKVIGALGGSYDVGGLSEMLFEDVYDEAGYSLIVTDDGQLVALDTDKSADPDGSFFDFYGSLEFSQGQSIENVKTDFQNQTGNIIRIGRGSDKRYLAYVPLNLNRWMLCYVVPIHNASAEYVFIRTYGLCLVLALLLGVVFLVVRILKINASNQNFLIMRVKSDPLTGLHNKVTTEYEINTFLKSEQGRGEHALIMLDLDRFKEINDTYGHAMGDAVLQQVADMLKKEFRSTDIIGRIGGDEFIVFMKTVVDRTAVVAHVESLCERMRHHICEMHPDAQLRCSVGIAYAPLHGQSFMELYQNVDRALYTAKAKGRDGYAVYGETTGWPGENVIQR